MERALSPCLALAIPFSAILLQGLNASRTAISVKPASSKHKAHGVNTVRNLLLGNDLNVPKAQLLKRLATGCPIVEFPHLNVMWQNVPAVTVILGLKPLDDLRQPLAAHLHVIDQASFLAHVLDEPNGRCVINAKIPGRIDLDCRLYRNPANG